MITVPFFLCIAISTYAFGVKGSPTTRKIFSILFSILIGLFFILNRANHDYAGYVDIFDEPELYAEPGYVLLINVVKFFGNFGHNAILFLLGIFVITTFLRYGKYTTYLCLAMLCYLIFPMPSDIVQIRNTFSLFCLLNAILEYTNKNRILCLCFLVAGASFQYLGLVYFPLFAIITLREKKYYLKLVICLSIASVFLYSTVIKLMSATFGLRNIDFYISNQIKMGSLITWGSILVLDIFVFSYLVKKINTKNCPAISLYGVTILYSIIVSSLVLIGGLLFLDEFNRVFRSMFVIKYLMGAMMFSYLSNASRLILVTHMLLTSCIFGLYYAYSLNYDYILFGRIP